MTVRFRAGGHVVERPRVEFEKDRHGVLVDVAREWVNSVPMPRTTGELSRLIATVAENVLTDLSLGRGGESANDQKEDQ